MGSQNIKHDYIIVGAGSAGSALANRLSENPKISVLLLEAGSTTHPYSRIPLSFGLFINKPEVNWRYFSEPEEGTANRAIPVPRGKMLGGSSAINGMVYVRGQPLDYDTWAQLGNRGWSWESVAPLFQKMENYSGRGHETRGTEGPLGISEVAEQNALYDALLDAAVSVGHTRNADYNGPDQEGVARLQATIQQGRRMNTAHCYLQPVTNRSNLNVITKAMTHKVLLEGTRCTGLVYEKNGELIEVDCGKEVILSAGGIASPQILELSGIGQPLLLQQHGIKVQHRLEAVGENFRDHLLPRVKWKLKVPEVSYNTRAQGIGLVRQVLKYFTTGKGFLSLPSASLGAWLKTRPELATPDIQMQFIPYSVESAEKRKLHSFPGMTIACFQLRPESLGSVHIRSNDPYKHPAIRFNFLSDPTDVQTNIDGVKMMREIVDAKPMDPYRDEEFYPGKSVSSDDEIEHFLREECETGYHPIGTCRMGREPNAVVDDQLKVHGLKGLRVADASIFPTMPSGNTNAPCIMVGEKAADLIKNSY